MAKYIKTTRELIARGMRRDKALLFVHVAFALSPEQIVSLAYEVK